MKKAERPALPAEVGLLQQRIEQWRFTRKQVSPMPESLWSAAVTLAAEHGVFRIARSVRIDFATLKTRLSQTAKQKVRSKSSSHGFIELGLQPAFAAPSQGEALLDFFDDSGAKMTCRLSGRVELDVIALANAFWNKP